MPHAWTRGRTQLSDREELWRCIGMAYVAMALGTHGRTQLGDVEEQLARASKKIEQLSQKLKVVLALCSYGPM